MNEVGSAGPSLDPSIEPFPGLRAFEANEEHLFFGREGQSEQILQAMRRTRLLAVVGTSGSGKSSLIRAGLIPYLYGGFLGGASSRWHIAILRPAATRSARLPAPSSSRACSMNGRAMPNSCNDRY